MFEMVLCDIVVWAIMSRCLQNFLFHFRVSRSTASLHSQSSRPVVPRPQVTFVWWHVYVVSAIISDRNSRWSDTLFVFNLLCHFLDVPTGPPHRRKQSSWACLLRSVTRNTIVPIRNNSQMTGASFFGSIQSEVRCSEYGKVLSPVWRTTHGPVY